MRVERGREEQRGLGGCILSWLWVRLRPSPPRPAATTRATEDDVEQLHDIALAAPPPLPHRVELPQILLEVRRRRCEGGERKQTTS